MTFAEIAGLFSCCHGQIDIVGGHLRSSIRRETDKGPAVGNGIYMWRAAKPVPRVRGENDAIYVGKAAAGPRQIKVDLNDPDNGAFYRHVVEAYGPITVWWADAETLRGAGVAASLEEQETEVLRAYFRAHLDRIPKNARSPILRT